MIAPLPSGPFAAILADPPWRFVTYSDTNKKKSPENHYATMDLDGIKAMPVASVAAPEAALFLWATSPMLPQALEVMAAWGFAYKTVAFTWAKSGVQPGRWHMGLGYWTRANTEYCLLGVRGHPVRKSRGVRQLMVAPRREHSRKPDETHDRIAALVDGPYLELFGRQSRTGWTVWGNESDKFDDKVAA
jgi:N6-adenosine-specific RNA methylase IME4